MRTILLGGLCGLLFSATAASAADGPARGVTTNAYGGWPGSIEVRASEAEAAFTVVPLMGGRVCRYELFSQNVLWENPGAYGRRMGDGGANYWPPGAQMDFGPELRGIPRHEEIFRGPWEVKSVRDLGVTLASVAHAGTGIQMEKELLLDPETGDLGITHRMKNISDTEKNYCFWDRTQCRAGGFVIVPLNKYSRMPARWSLRHIIENRAVYDALNPSHPSVKVLGDCLVIEATAKEDERAKIGLDSDAEWVAYALGTTLFVKYFPWDWRGNYTDAGNSVEVYWDHQFAELEPLSQEHKIAPGQTVSFPQKWTLIQLKQPVRTHKEARKLVEKIPPSPFRLSK